MAMADRLGLNSRVRGGSPCFLRAADSFIGVNMSQYELHPANLRHWRQRLALRILNGLGWKLRYKPLPGTHGIAILYPHTSNWDVVIGLLCRIAVGLPFSWLGKENLFKGLTGATLGRLLSRFGCLPVERSTSTGAIQRLAERMREREWCWIALAPEGTRSYRPHWRSGFYHLALSARVPVLLMYIDYPNKEFGAVDSIRLSGDPDRDMASIAAIYEGRAGLHPEWAAPVTLAKRPEDTGRQA
jgi:1-acyl-sn-glycerol-3-phosphate acyltransferase